MHLRPLSATGVAAGVVFPTHWPPPWISGGLLGTGVALERHWSLTREWEDKSLIQGGVRNAAWLLCRRIASRAAGLVPINTPGSPIENARTPPPLAEPLQMSVAVMVV